MSTFVVRFIGTDGPCAGLVRHVATGEEASFTSLSELLAFFEERVPSVGALGTPVGDQQRDTTPGESHPSLPHDDG